MAPNAIAYEDTPPARTTVRFIWKRGVRDGAVSAQRIAMKDWPRHRKIMQGGRLLLAKLGHALNHFFWSPLAPWRGVKGVGDIGSVLAILLFALGHRFHFYGGKPKNPHR